jgi:asparagine synthase (glutamine-hydrolysing)
MHDPATGNWLIFNGEIYNFRSVRALLERCGQQFTTQTDTEVILKAYAHWGQECLQHLHGMFAFALWDAQRERLWVARDRLGIKPLYYACPSDRMLVIASEVRAILASELVPRTLAPKSLRSFLQIGAVLAPWSIVEDVNSLMPGEMACISPSRPSLSPQTYWRPETSLAQDGEFEQNGMAVASLRDRLQEIVSEHLVSDVPLGIFLSGGVDSSVLAALAKRCGNRDLMTLVVSFDEPEFDETRYAQAVAKHLDVKLREIRITSQFFCDQLDGALAAMDQPSMDGINTHTISRAARAAGLTVALSGLGGDELFGGYPSFRRVPAMFRFNRCWPGVCRRLAAWGKLGRGGTVGARKLWQSLSGTGDLLETYQIVRALFLPWESNRLLGSVGGNGAGRWSMPSWYDQRISSDSPDLETMVSLLELVIYTGNVLLRDTDWASMDQSLEVRVPLLDDRLVEMALGLPGHVKHLGDSPKKLLMDLLAVDMPASLLRRPKQGFVFPLEVWLRTHLAGQLESTFSGKDVWERCGINAAAARQVWRQFQGRDAGVTWSRVWALFSLAEYVRRHDLVLPAVETFADGPRIAPTSLVANA